MKKRRYEDETADIDRKLLSGLHHVGWMDKGGSADKTRYKTGVLKESLKKQIHKTLV